MTTLGRSGIVVNPISAGMAALGGLYRSVSETDASDLVDAAFEAGISYFDTAPQYGHGTSEARLGRAFGGRDRDSFALSSKVGRLVRLSPDGDTGKFADAPASDMVFAFDRDSVLRSIEESLERLGLDRLDMIYIHDPDDYADQAIDETYPVLAELRAEGTIRGIGVGMNQSAIPTRFVEETEIDAVLLAGRYTLLDQSGAADLLPIAEEKGVSIVVGGVFNSGILADPEGAPTYDYELASPEIRQKVAKLGEVCSQHGVSLITAAVAFPLRHNSVATVLMGPRNRAELEQTMALDLAGVPEDLWLDLAEQGLIQ